MDNLDTENLFKIFTSGDEEVYKEHGVEDVLDNSYTLLGMVIKGVENYYVLDLVYNKKYKESYTSVRNGIKLMYFTGLMKYLERIDMSRSDTLLLLKEEFGDQPILFAFQEMLSFFEEREYYEQCSVIKNIHDLFFPDVQ